MKIENFSTTSFVVEDDCVLFSNPKTYTADIKNTNPNCPRLTAIYDTAEFDTPIIINGFANEKISLKAVPPDGLKVADIKMKNGSGQLVSVFFGIPMDTNYSDVEITLSEKSVSNITSQTSVSNLDTAMLFITSTTIGKYALFAAGINGDGQSKEMHAYDDSLVHTLASPLDTASLETTSTTAGNYALFGMGDSDAVYAYNKDLTKTLAPPLSMTRYNGNAETVGKYALFAGGYADLTGDGFDYTEVDIVDAYDDVLTHTTVTPMSVARSDLTSMATGNYALFVGGATPTESGSNYVDAYDDVLTHITANPTMRPSSVRTKSTTVGRYALANYFGWIVLACDEMLTYTEINNALRPPSGGAARFVAPVSTKTYALFAGGIYGSRNSFDHVFLIDSALTSKRITPLSRARRTTAASVGNYVLFVGGLYERESWSNLVDVYQEDL